MYRVNIKSEKGQEGQCREGRSRKAETGAVESDRWKSITNAPLHMSNAQNHFTYKCVYTVWQITRANMRAVPLFKQAHTLLCRNGEGESSLVLRAEKWISRSTPEL